MKSVREFIKSDRIFFENENEEIQYHKHCLSCAICDCKQSYRVLTIMCKKRVKTHTLEQYEEKIKESNLSLRDICKKIGINTSSLKSALDNNRDMEQEWYVKLEKELYNKNINKK